VSFLPPSFATTSCLGACFKICGWQLEDKTVLHTSQILRHASIRPKAPRVEEPDRGWRPYGFCRWHLLFHTGTHES
jgi:hypothetical protein